jgi:hypothetical protein
MINPAKTSVQKHRKKLLWALGLLAAYAIVGFLILPMIVRSVAVKQISRQLDREVSIESVKINPFALSTSIRGLLIKDKDGEPFVSWDEVYVNFQLASFFGKAWVFKEISTSKPFVRAVMNRDGTFNFTDLITKFSTNAAPAEPKPAKPLVLRVERLQISGATTALADYTLRTPFRRTLGPLDIVLDDFRTDPDNQNLYAFHGTTDTGEQYAWRGHFSFEPLRSDGELDINQVVLNKYAPLYQDLVSFEIRDGSIGLHAKYRVEWSATNRVVAVTNTALALRDFKLAAVGASNNLVELPLLGVAGVSFDLQKHQANVGTVYVTDGNIFVARNKENAINVVQLAKPSEPSANASGGILVLLRSVTNAVTMLLQSTNQWAGTISSVNVTNCALHLEDLVNSRPAKLDLTGINFTAKNISNLPGTNLEAQLSVRWNTNGSIKFATTASFLPPTVDVQLDLDRLDLGTLDPYLEPKLDLFILGSQLGLHGAVRLRTPEGRLPEVTFHGDVNLDNFHTVDGAFGEDLIKWDALRFNGIDANLNPQSVAIKEIIVDNAYARLIIETNHTVNLLNALRLTNTNAPATNEVKIATSEPARADTRPTQPPTSETNAALPQISIGAIVISNTAFSFSDRSMKPAVNLSIRDVNGRIAGLSTEQLQHAEINLDAKIDGVGPAAITGTLNPFSGTETNSLKISVKDMDLTPASPYAGKFAGYRIAQGKLNLDLAYELIGKKLTSKNVITLNQFTFGERVESPDATHLPVRLAIAIMKDRDGKIVLDVPIEGSLDDPKFRIGKVVTRAILNILTKVATSPFSLLGAVFGGGGEELGYQDFAVGSADLTDGDKQKLDALQKALFARPALNLEINGSVEANGDREGLQRAALDRDIRTRLWLKLRKAEQATNTVDQLVLPPEERANWVKKIYDEAVGAGKITPELVAANTNLAAYVAAVLPSRTSFEKGATKLMNSGSVAQKKSAAGAAYQTRLVPPPTPTEALLLVTYPVIDADLDALAVRRAKAVQAYLLQNGQVTAARLFLKDTRRNDGSRVYLQFR